VDQEVARSRKLLNDAPTVFPLGMTTVTWTARDAHKNVGGPRSSVITLPRTKPLKASDSRSGAFASFARSSSP
jgi:hypothetical protein